MLLRLDNSDLLSLEFSLWLSLKGAIWPRFVVPDAFLVAAMGPDLFLPDHRVWKSSSPAQENIRPPSSCVFPRCSLLAGDLFDCLL